MTAWRRSMGLNALEAKPRLRQPAEGHPIDPDLVRGVTVERVTQVWRADSTDVRLATGFVSVVAVIDCLSR